jgi:hypothetical protein
MLDMLGVLMRSRWIVVAETNAVRQVFPNVRVLWCQYHVLQAMIRNITSKLAEKQGQKVSIAISQTERGRIKKMLWKLALISLEK